METPQTRYARGGDRHIAYQTLGEGPPDLLYVSGWFSHVDVRWEDPASARLLRTLASFSRLIMFDRRGTGASDPAPTRPPVLEDWVADARLVLDAASSERAAIYGVAEGGPMALLLAATHPGLVSALVLVNSGARGSPAPGYPWGMPEALRDPELIEQVWGTNPGPFLRMVAPSVAEDPGVQTWWAKYQRLSAGPAEAVAAWRMILDIDVRAILPTIQVPTLVIHRRDAIAVPVDNGRYLAEHIPGARLVELPGADTLAHVGDQDAILGEVEEFLTGARVVPAIDRQLTTLMFTDIVDSTRIASEVGDRRWRDLLEGYRNRVRREVARFGGREIQTMGDGLLATFDGPARAVRCARGVVESGPEVGLQLRAGVHTGEVELMGQDVGGLAVHLGYRVAAAAGPGEVLVSSTVKDLVAGSEIEFEDRGAHTLKGVPGEWRLYAVAN